MAKESKLKLTKRLVNSLNKAEKLYRVWDSEIPGFNLKVRPSGVKTFTYYYRNDVGVLIEYTIARYGVFTVDEARAAALDLASQVKKGIDIQRRKADQRQKEERDKKRTLSAFIDLQYQPWVLMERKSGRQTLDLLNSHFGFLMKKPMEDITVWEVTKWRTEKLKKGRSRKTANRYIGALKAVLSKAVEWGVIELNPISVLKPLKVDDRERKRFLTDQEEKLLRQVLSSREKSKKLARDRFNEWRRSRNKVLKHSFNDIEFYDHIKPMLLLLMNTGVRPGELFRLKWVDVNLKNKILEIIGENSKSGRSRFIPLNQEAFGVMLQWRNQFEGSDLVFPSPVDGSVMQRMPKSVNRVFEKAGLKNFRVYDLRHTFASMLAMKGVDLNTIRELLGHEDISTTMIYAHLSPGHKATAVELLGNGRRH